MKFDIQAQAIPDIKLITPKKFGDERGYFSETYQREDLAQAGITADFMQDNQAYSAQAYTLRGLHFQAEPFAQDKLVRVVRGAIFDVVVDIRRSSLTYGQWTSAVLSADNWAQLLVPKGFAHGLLTLEPDTEVLYKVSKPYSPEHDCSIRWDDPALGIDWPLNGHQPHLSDKDRRAPTLAGYLETLAGNLPGCG